MKNRWHKKFAGYYIPGGRFNFILIIAATAFVTWLHIGEEHVHSVIHLFHYYLFYLIVIYTAHSFGFLGGIISAFVLSIIYNARFYLFGEAPQDLVRPILEVAMMYTLGIFSGLFSQKLYLEKEKLLEVSEELKKSIGFIEKTAEEKIKLEKEIARTDRLRVLGQLTAGIAHEIRNPLAAIKSGVQMIKAGKGNEQIMDVVSSEIHRLNAFIERFLQYAKVGKVQETDIFVKEFAAELEEFLRLTCKDRRNVAIETGFSVSDRVCIRGDKNYLKQAFLNVLLNAAEAVEKLPYPGVVTFSAEAENDSVIFTVRDNGPGIEESRLENVFEPFYTTKDTGTGLGLTIAAKVIKEHGGDIFVENDHGARVIIKLQGHGNE